MFDVRACARHQVTPKECHLHVVKRIVRYLKGHPKLGLWYLKESPFDLVAYSDSDYGGVTQDMKSTTGGYDNVADLLTKPFDVGRFQHLVGEGLAIPTEPHPTPSSQEQHSSHHDTSSPSHPNTTTEPIPQTPTETPTLRQYSRRATRISQSKALSPAADEPASLLRDDSQREAFPTVYNFNEADSKISLLCTRIDKSILRLFDYFTVPFHFIVIPLDHQRVTITVLSKVVDPTLENNRFLVLVFENDIKTCLSSWSIYELPDGKS
nr:putative ribonuclease H-like domain-containing protein [Tanacetum cinerariifolium]